MVISSSWHPQCGQLGWNGVYRQYPFVESWYVTENIVAHLLHEKESLFVVINQDYHEVFHSFSEDHLILHLCIVPLEELRGKRVSL